jgi:hypothetical protein
MYLPISKKSVPRSYRSANPEYMAVAISHLL